MKRSKSFPIMDRSKSFSIMDRSKSHYHIQYKLGNYMGKRSLRIQECQFLKSA